MSKDKAYISDDERFWVAEAAEAVCDSEEDAMIEAGNLIMPEEMEEEEDADCPEEEDFR